MVGQLGKREFATSNDDGFAGQFIGSASPDGASIAAGIATDLGLADLGIGTQANPAPFSRPENQIATPTDGNGNLTTVELNEYGVPIGITNAIGRTKTLVRDVNNLVTAITEPSDGELPDTTVPGFVVTEPDYDASGNVTARREAVGTTLERETRFEYQPTFNRVTKIADPASFETLFEYHATGNITKTTAALGSEQISTYDARGPHQTALDANLNPTQFTYDAIGNGATITDAELNQTVLVRDSAGNVTARTEGGGAPEVCTATMTFDAMNRVLTEADFTGATTSMAHHAAGGAALFSADRLGLPIKGSVELSPGSPNIDRDAARAGCFVSCSPRPD